VRQELCSGAEARQAGGDRSGWRLARVHSAGIERKMRAQWRA
jgi:hypothetical protein